MSRHIAGRGRSGPQGVPAQPPVDEVECSLDTKLTLGQFLKLAGLIDSGAEAKDAIGAGLVTVDGETETRRGRGLEDGNVVTFDDRSARVLARPTSQKEQKQTP